MPNYLAWCVTFLFINASWVFFRAEELNVATNIIKGMLGLNGVTTNIENIPSDSLDWLGVNADYLFSLFPNGLVSHILPFTLSVFVFYIISCENAIQIVSGNLTKIKVGYCALLFVVSGYIMATSSSSVFLYFNF